MTTAERWTPPDLAHAVCLVTGASYGVGRGICEVLGECGATVYVTARSRTGAATKDERWTVEETVRLVEAGGGTGIPIAVDHGSPEEVAGLLSRIDSEQGRLDLLVNNVWQWGPARGYEAPSWQQPVARWDAMVGVGLRANFVTTRAALPLLLRTGRGLVVSTQERPGDERHFGQNVVVDVAAVALQRMVAYLARELAGTGVAVLLLYLGWVRSVNMGMGFDPEAAGMSSEELKRRTQSPHLTGRAVAALAADPAVASLSGRTLYVGEVARTRGFTDVDGRIPPYEGA